ncbi:prophage CP4-57 regulatory family protein [Collimonas fungivorans]|uniref:Prophage CP4-57 regulatory family protein n=1 Tax=Collimonas fungivorans TaxID=158899 RepID=A0A127P8B5_9BURK|nr:AlpA family phage regulatory protein [Collimonas fungivorans]AMO93998.1 prophage CP4-57 regulatory family protein [Collimonas fungivorans]
MTQKFSHRVSNGALPETGFVRLPTILKIYPISRSAWWQGVRDGRLPKSVHLGPKTTAWRVEDIRALIDAQAK